MDGQEYVVKITANIQDYVKKMSDVTSTLKFTDKQAKSISKSLSRAMSSASPSVQKLGLDMKNLAVQYDTQIAKIQDFASKAADAGEQVKRLSLVHAEQAAQIQATEQEVERLTDAYNEALRTQAEMQAAMQSGKGVKADVWGRVNQDVTDAKARLDEMAGTLLEQRDALSQTENTMQSWASTAGLYTEAAGNMSQATENTKNQLLTTSNAVGKLTSRLSGIGKVFASVGKAAISLAGTTAKLVKDGFGKLSTGVKNVVKRFKETVTHSHQTNAAIKRLTASFSSFAHLLIRRFKRAIISQIFNGIKEGIQNVAKESESFNNAVSSMGSSLQTFANAIIGTFAPIIQAAAPYISAFVDYLTNAVTQISQLTARLFGGNTYLKAQKVQWNYAKSLLGTAKATEKANKASKEYKNTVLSFDQLHVLNSQDDNDDDNTSTDSANDAPAFQTTEISDNVKGIADKLVDAFKSHDWGKLGGLMADGVNRAFSWVDNLINWENCGEKITEIVHSITTTFNSFISGIDWGLIGQTIGDGVNTIFNSLYLLITGIDWALLGKNFRTGVLSFLGTVDWYKAGQTIVAGIQKMLDMVKNFTDKDENGDSVFSNLGKSLRTGLKGAIDELSPTKWGETLANIVNGIFAFIKELFADTKQWEKLGDKLASNINTFFENLQPEDISNGINAFLDAVLAFAGSLIPGLNWESIGTKIGEAIADIHWDKALALAGVVVGGLLLGKLITGLPALVITGFTHLAGLLPALVGLIFSHPIITCIAVIGTLIGLLIYKYWDKIVAWAQSLPGKISAWFTARANDFKNWWHDVKAWASEKFNHAVQAIKDTFQPVADFLGGLWQDISSAAQVAWDAIGRFISDPIEAAKDAIDLAVSAIRDFLDFTGLSTTIHNALSGVKEALCWPFERAWEIIKPIIDGIKSFDPMQAAQDIGQQAMSGQGFLGGLARMTVPGFGNIIDMAGVSAHAEGGFVEDGLFYANHNELVGTFSNGKTAVANNSQITDGISIAVADAVVPLMLEMLTAIKDNKNGSPVIEMDGEKVARIITKNQRRTAAREFSYV